MGSGDQQAKRSANKKHKQDSLAAKKSLETSSGADGGQATITIPTSLLGDLKFLLKLFRAGYDGELSSSDICKQKAAELSLEHKTTMKTKLPAVLRQGVSYEIEITQDIDELESALKRKFKLIFISETAGLTPNHGWGIGKQIKSMGSSHGQAHQPLRAAVDGKNPTRDATYTQMENLLLRPHLADPLDRLSSFLDIESRHLDRFSPAAIDSVDLVQRIHRDRRDHHDQHDQHDPSTGRQWGREGVDQPEKRLMKKREWMILSNECASSPFHVDAAGYCTAVVVLEGSKLWYVPMGETWLNWERLHLSGPQYTEWPGGLSTVLLDAGACLIQAPGTIHGVITRVNTLMAGCFFYTSQHFAQSLETIAYCQKDKLYDNDEIKAADFSDLTLVVEHLNDDRYFTTEQRENVYYKMEGMLDAFGMEKDDGKKVNGKKKKGNRGKKKGNGKKDKDNEEKEEQQQVFLDACQKWRAGHKKHMGEPPTASDDEMEYCPGIVLKDDVVKDLTNTNQEDEEMDG